MCGATESPSRSIAFLLCTYSWRLLAPLLLQTHLLAALHTARSFFWIGFMKQILALILILLAVNAPQAKAHSRRVSNYSVCWSHSCGSSYTLLYSYYSVRRYKSRYSLTSTHLARRLALLEKLYLQALLALRQPVVQQIVQPVPKAHYPSINVDVNIEVQTPSYETPRPNEWTTPHAHKPHVHTPKAHSHWQPSQSPQVQAAPHLTPTPTPSTPVPPIPTPAPELPPVTSEPETLPAPKRQSRAF
jgi:uncharacterized membrane protein